MQGAGYWVLTYTCIFVLSTFHMSIHIFRAFHIWAPAIFANSQQPSNNIAIALAIAPLFDSFVTPTIFVGGCSLRYIKQKTFKTATFHHIFHTANNLFEWMYEYHSVASSFYKIYVHQFSSMWMNNKTVGRQTEIDEERESERQEGKCSYDMPCENSFAPQMIGL